LLYRPGNWLKHEEDEIEGVQRILDELFEPDNAEAGGVKWQIGDAVGSWWRPNFETSLYPYIPAHVTRPKEVKKMYIIPLPQKSKSNYVSCVS
jgi:cleavage and polyadenylation specificity factor subunit 5